MTTFSKSQVVSLLPVPYSSVPGWQEPVELQAPAAGAATADYLVQGPEYELLYAVAATLTTSAVTGSRYLNLLVSDRAGRVFQRDDMSLAVSPGSAVEAYAAIGKQLSLEGSGTSNAPIPAYLLPPGWSFSIEISGVQAGDLLSDMYLIVHKIPSDNARQVMILG